MNESVRAEVAEAMSIISDLHPHGVPTVEGLAAYRATQTIRDYLLQVTAERDHHANFVIPACMAMQRAGFDDGEPGEFIDALHERAEKVEAERDALRARIAAAPFVTMSRAEVCAWDMPDSWSGKRVRLVLEDGNG
jgi:hypothetical protein